MTDTEEKRPVVALSPERPNKECLESARDLVKAVEDGRVMGLAWTYTTLDGGSHFQLVQAPGRSGKLEVLGAIRLLETAAMERWFENN